MRKTNDPSAPKPSRFGRNRGEVRMPTSEAPDQLAFPQAAVSPDEAARIAASLAPSAPTPRRFGRPDKAPGATPATPDTAAFPDAARAPAEAYEERGTPVAQNQLAFPQAALSPQEARKIAADLQPRPQDKIEQVWVQPARVRTRNRVLALTVGAGLVVVVIFFFSPLNPRHWTPETPEETTARHAREVAAQAAYPVKPSSAANTSVKPAPSAVASTLPVAAQVDQLMKEADNQQLAPEGYEDAIQSYRRALLLLDKNTVADTPLRRIVHYRIATLLNNSNHFLEAADEYRATAALGQPDADLQNSLGVALFDSGQSDQIAPAAQAFREALRINPNLVAAWTNLAAVQERTGDVAGANKSRKNAERLSGVTPASTGAFMSGGATDPGLAPPPPTGINGVTGIPMSVPR